MNEVKLITSNPIDELKQISEKADTIYWVVAFAMKSGVKLVPPFFKQEKSFIQQSTEIRLNAVMNDKDKTRELLKYHEANEFQMKLFDMIMAEPFPSPIHEAAGIIALITEKNCDAKKILKDYQVVWSIAINSNDGVQIDNVKAVFRERMGMPINRYKEIKERNTM